MLRLRNTLIGFFLIFLWYYLAFHIFVAWPYHSSPKLGEIFLGPYGGFALFHPGAVFSFDLEILKASLPSLLFSSFANDLSFDPDFLISLRTTTLLIPSCFMLLTVLGVGITQQKNKATVKGPTTDKLRGISRVDNPSEYFRLARKLAAKFNPGVLIHPKVPLPYSAESEGLLILGGTGSGKTKSAVNLLVKGALKRGDRLVILDTKGDFTAALFGKPGVQLLAPWDTRSVQWDISKDMPRGFLDAEMLGNAVLPPIPNDHQPVFRDSAFSIFAGALACLQHAGNLSWATLWDTVTDLGKLHKVLSTYDSGLRGLSAIGGKDDAVKFQSNMLSKTAWLPHLVKAWPKPSFSIRSWMREEGEGVLILRYASDFPELSRSLCSMVASILIAELLSWPVTNAKPVWFFLDEVAQLGIKIGSLAEGITAGRERGGRFVLATQDVTRLWSIYGREEGQSILNSLRTLVAFWAGDKTNAEYCADCLGAKQEQTIKTFSDGKNTQNLHLFGGGTSHNESVNLRDTELVKPGEIMDLGKGEAFLRVPGLPITKLQWPQTIFDVDKTDPATFLAPWVHAPEKPREVQEKPKQKDDNFRVENDYQGRDLESTGLVLSYGKSVVEDDQKARAHHLIQLGALVEKAGLDGLDPAALFGFLLIYRVQSEENKRTWTVEGVKALAVVVSKKGTTEQDRKERTHHLIQLGALVEKAELACLDPAALLGFLLLYPAQPEENKRAWSSTGAKALAMGKDDKDSGKGGGGGLLLDF